MVVMDGLGWRGCGGGDASDGSDGCGGGDASDGSDGCGGGDERFGLERLWWW